MGGSDYIAKQRKQNPVYLGRNRQKCLPSTSNGMGFL